MEYSLPDLIISKELVERIQFSVSSRNAEAKLGECAVHVFAAPYSDNPHDIKWQYVSSGVACLLRNRELAPNGRKYMWSMSLCLYNASYGVLVWKARLVPNSDYTAVADNFHVFAMGEVNVLVGLMFSSKEKACELNTTYTKWHQERMRDDGKKGIAAGGGGGGAGGGGAGGGGGVEPVRFRKEMISKPCNFQHIQGTQAIDECMDIEKIKSDIIAAFFGLGTKAGRSETDGTSPQKSSKKKKKEPPKKRLEFKEILLPQAQLATSPSSPPPPHAAGSPVSPPFTPGSLPPAAMPPPGQMSEPPHHLTHQSSQPRLSPSSPSGPLPPGMPPEQFSPTGGFAPPPPIMSSSVGEGPNTYHDSGFQERSGPVKPPKGGVNPLLPQSSSNSLRGYNPEPNGYPGSPTYEDQSGRHSSSSQARSDSRRGDRGEMPNFQNPASPAFQEYGGPGSSQDSYSYGIPPPRLDMSLEKEFAESALFKSSIMTAN